MEMGAKGSGGTQGSCGSGELDKGLPQRRRGKRKVFLERTLARMETG